MAMASCRWGNGDGRVPHSNLNDRRIHAGVQAMIFNDRRRPALPAELVGRVFAIWLADALLQLAAVAIVGS